MRVISRQTLKTFWESGHAAAQQPLCAWFAEVSREKWNSMADVKVRFPHASIIDAERIVFNIGGNNYRLIVKVWFPGQTLFIKFVGTHREYDRVNVKAL